MSKIVEQNKEVHAAASGEVSAVQTEVSHEQTLFAEEIANIGGFPITNALLNTWLVVAIVLIFSIYLKKKIKEVPGAVQNILEIVVEEFLNIFDSVTGSRQKSLQFFPFVFSFFLLILINNLIGLLPGVGSIGAIVTEDGHSFFAPYFRGGMADLNSTLALSIIGVVASHIFGVVAVGWWRHLNKFFNIKAIIDIPKNVAKDPMVLIVNPINVFVGFIEIIGEMAKIASLSFRLFGNIFAGEVLLASMGAIMVFFLPIPFMFMEVLVGVIQALVFSMLILAYLAMNTSAEEH